ncbi:MAG: hypothetical protein ACOC1I_05750 [Spirochaetota bacterium]
MKTMLLVVFALVPVLLPAQEFYLVNETESTLYLLTDASGGAFESLSPGAAYRQIPAGGLLPVFSSRPLEGFAFERGSFQLPTFSIGETEVRERASVSEAGRRYVSVEPDDLTEERVVSASQFAALLGAPRIDGQYLDWVSRDARVARGRARAPLGVFADFGDGRETIDIDQSLLWRRGGTDLQWIKTGVSADDLFLAGSVYTAFARGTAIFIYVYRESDRVPFATLEFPIGTLDGARSGETDFVLLWLPARREPRVVGTFVASEFLFETQIWLDVLSELVDQPLDEMVVELSTASSAAGIWEEFVLVRERFSVLFGE